MNRRVASRFTLGLVLPLLFAALSTVSAQEDVFTGIERVVAIGDVHGDHDQFVAVLRSAELIDAQGKWTGGKTHLVQTGDLLDRGPDSRKAMDLLMRLEEEARRAGGAVHALIGNHEAMNLYGDLRYVSPGEYAAFRDANSEKARDELYKEEQKRFPDRKRWEADHPLGFAEHRRAFGPTGTYGKWIRGHNVIVQIDDTIFLHGGLSPKMADWTVRKINEQARSELEDFAKLQVGIVMDNEGPLWYRGLAELEEKALEPQADAILKNYNVQRIVIGHTVAKEGSIMPRVGGKVVMIDIGLCRIYDPKLRMACLVIEKGKPSVLHRGKRLEFPSDPGVDLLRYFKQAAALDPSPSPLGKRIAELEARLAAPSRK
jgi:hypothetical protein